MKRILCTFSGAKYSYTTGRIATESKDHGSDEVWIADDWWLRNCRPDYWEKTQWFREQPGVRGVDWFLFKPFYLLDLFRRLDDGDVLMHTDADTFPVADLTPLYEQCVKDGGVMLFSARGCVNKIWTKRDCFILMGCDEPKYHDTWQAVGRFMLFQKGGDFPAEKFLCEWLGATANPIANTFAPSILAPEYEGFRQHRAEQSCLTNLAVRYGLPMYRELCEFGYGYPGDVPSAQQPCERDCVGHQVMSQHGGHSYAPGRGDQDGSEWRNINE